MNAKKAIFLDMDGVMVDMVPTMCRMMENYKKTPFPLENFSQLNSDFERNPQKYTEFREIFSHSEEYGNLPPILGIVDLLNKLHKTEYDLFVITAALDSQQAKKLRISNIEKLFGNIFKEIHIIDAMPKSKVIDDIIKRHGYENTTFIDDDPTKASACINIVNTSVWFDSGYLSYKSQGLNLGRILIAKTANELERILL